MTFLFQIGDSRSGLEVVGMVAHTHEFSVAGSDISALRAALGHAVAAIFVLTVGFIAFQVLTFDAGAAANCLPDICTIAG
jgi:hypothetical protein